MQPQPTKPSTAFLTKPARLLFGVLAVATGILLGSPAEPVHAQEQDSTEYTFGDELVPGDLQRPEGERLFVRKDRARESLIRPRTSFARELWKSAEDL